MTDITLASGAIDLYSDLGTGDEALYRFWMGQEQIAAKQEETWASRGSKIIKRYRDERNVTDKENHRFNILWSNVQTLIPTLYARTPKPDVQRRFLDQDDIGRLASTLMERCLSYSVDKCDFDSVMQAVVQDRLLPGRGIGRVVYTPHFGEDLPEPEIVGEDNTVETEESAPPQALREVTYEEASFVYVYWGDYREGPARTWKEVPWNRFRSYMTRQELIDRFGAKKGNAVTLDYTPSGLTSEAGKEPPDIFKKAQVFEFWDKANKKVIWLPPGTPDLILDEQDDPLNLPGFFPNPDPLLSTTTTDNRIPVPDYTEYQDQADELDNLTSRIDVLTRALKMSGVYPGEQKDILNQLIQAGTDNKLIPVEDWNGWGDKGGLSGFIQWMPIKEVAETLIQLYAARDKTKDLLYEITGIGDIMRGQTNPNETFGAQQLKSNFATRRIVPQQRRVAVFARDAIRLMGGVIAEQFSPATISAITGYPQLLPVPPLPPPPPQFLPPPMAPMMPPAGMQPPAAPS